MARKVLTTARQVARIAAGRQAEFDAAEIEWIFPSTTGIALTEAELLRQLPGCFAAAAMPDAYTGRVIAACAPTLKIIARAGVRFDSVDLETASEYGVWVTTTPGSNHDAVADYALTLMLAMLRDLTATVNQTRAGTWKRMVGVELRGKRLGIIGTGRVGREVGARARAFGMELLAHDLYPNEAWAAQVGATYVSLDTLLAESDVVTLHAPMTPETRYLLNAKTLAMMKRGSYVVNTARGELVDEAAMIEALDSGHVAGAALDVFSEEPPTDRRLIDHPRVLPTPHSAGGTHEAYERSAHMVLDDILLVARGEPPRNPANRLG